MVVSQTFLVEKSSWQFWVLPVRYLIKWLSFGICRMFFLWWHWSYRFGGGRSRRSSAILVTSQGIYYAVRTSHRHSGVRAVSIRHHCRCYPRSLAWSSEVLPLWSSSPSTTLPYCTPGRKSLCTARPLGVWGYTSHFKTDYLHKLF